MIFPLIKKKKKKKKLTKFKTGKKNKNQRKMYLLLQYIVAYFYNYAK